MLQILDLNSDTLVNFRKLELTPKDSAFAIVHMALKRDGFEGLKKDRTTFINEWLEETINRGESEVTEPFQVIDEIADHFVYGSGYHILDAKKVEVNSKFRSKVCEEVLNILSRSI